VSVAWLGVLGVVLWRRFRDAPTVAPPPARDALVPGTLPEDIVPPAAAAANRSSSSSSSAEASSIPTRMSGSITRSAKGTAIRADANCACAQKKNASPQSRLLVLIASTSDAHRRLARRGWLSWCESAWCDYRFVIPPKETPTAADVVAASSDAQLITATSLIRLAGSAFDDQKPPDFVLALPDDAGFPCLALIAEELQRRPTHRFLWTLSTTTTTTTTTTKFAAPSVASDGGGGGREASSCASSSSSTRDLTKCDLFSLGATAYELLSGRPLPPNGDEWHRLRDGPPSLRASSGTTTTATARQHHGASSSSSSTGGGVPESLDATVCAMMRPDPAARPAAADLLRTTKELLSHVEQLEKQLERERNHVAQFRNQVISLNNLSMQRLSRSNTWA